jgi:hypothetical protein
MKMLVRDLVVLLATKRLVLLTMKSLRSHHQSTPALTAVAGAVMLP